MIKIKKSPTADTRTCDWSKVTEEELLSSSIMHIQDVQKGLKHFANELVWAGKRHDHDKLSCIKEFHSDFKTGFKVTTWYQNHKQVNRHHLQDKDGIRDDVNLVDVIEYITDCTMAGMARSGDVYELELPNELLQKAFKNTAEQFKKVVSVDK